MFTSHCASCRLAMLHDDHVQSCCTGRNDVKRACVFITGIDSMLAMHRLAWERTGCAAVIIASHRLRAGG